MLKGALLKNIYILSDAKVKGAKNLPVIKQIFFKKDIDFSKYDYIIFTSKKGVEAADKISFKWRYIPALAIGKATAKKIESLGAKVEFTATKFYGDEFAKELSGILDKKSKLLYIRPKVVLSNLTQILKENGFLIDEVVLYETICQECSKLEKPKKNSYIIFSSPSTIKCFFRCFSWDDSYKAVAIGKKTASFIPKNINYILSPKQTLKECVEYILGLG